MSKDLRQILHLGGFWFGQNWDFSKSNSCILTFWEQKLLKTCRKHASEVGQSLKWVDLAWKMREIMKIVGEIGQNGGIPGMGVWKFWNSYFSL